MRRMPKRASAVAGAWRLPRVTVVAAEGTTMPELRRPMKAMKRPMPPATAAWSWCGMAASRLLADAGKGEQEEDDAGEEDGAEGGLPGNAHAFDDGVGEVGVEAHAGCEGEGVVGHGAHEDGAEGGAEAGADGDGGERHAGFGEDGRVDEDDVGHGDESGEAGEELGAPGGAVLGEAEVLFETGSHRRRVPPVWMGVAGDGTSIAERFLDWSRFGAERAGACAGPPPSPGTLPLTQEGILGGTSFPCNDLQPLACSKMLIRENLCPKSLV